MIVDGDYFHMTIIKQQHKLNETSHIYCQKKLLQTLGPLFVLLHLL